MKKSIVFFFFIAFLATSCKIVFSGGGEKPKKVVERVDSASIFHINLRPFFYHLPIDTHFQEVLNALANSGRFTLLKPDSMQPAPEYIWAVDAPDYEVVAPDSAYFYMGKVSHINTTHQPEIKNTTDGWHVSWHAYYQEFLDAYLECISLWQKVTDATGQRGDTMSIVKNNEEEDIETVDIRFRIDTLYTHTRDLRLYIKKANHHKSILTLEYRHPL